jgi:hypothetical protein
MSKPIALTDAQLTELMRLARPLQPGSRDVFLRLIAHELRDHDDIGDGLLFRTARDLIKMHRLFDPPLAIEEGSDGHRRPRRGKYA